MFLEYLKLGINEFFSKCGIFSYIFIIILFGSMIILYGIIVYQYNKGKEIDTIYILKKSFKFFAIAFFLAIIMTLTGLFLSPKHIIMGIMVTFYCFLGLCYLFLLILTWYYFFKIKKK